MPRKLVSHPLVSLTIVFLGIPICALADCNGNGIQDEKDIFYGTSRDCHENGIPDECDIALGISADLNSNGIPDECELEPSAVRGSTLERCSNPPPAGELVDIVFVVDSSGSVTDDYQKQLMAVANAINEPDAIIPADGTVAVAVIKFSQEPFTYVPLTVVDSPYTASSISQTVLGMTGPAGETIPGCAFERAMQILTECANGEKRYVVFTCDGGFDGHYEGTFEASEALRTMETPVTICSGHFGDTEDTNKWYWPQFVLGMKKVANTDDFYSDDCDAIYCSRPREYGSQPHGEYRYIPIADSGEASSELQELCRWCFCDKLNDCNCNSLDDIDDVISGRSEDCNGNSIPDECEPDCNNNSFPDECDIAERRSDDCNANMIPDECEPDCNNNEIPDECDIVEERCQDCDRNGIPDECEFVDCNANSIFDVCEITWGVVEDCDGDGVPDECRIVCDDCDHNGVLDVDDITTDPSLDLNLNGLIDYCEGSTLTTSFEYPEFEDASLSCSGAPPVCATPLDGQNGWYDDPNGAVKGRVSLQQIGNWGDGDQCLNLLANPGSNSDHSIILGPRVTLAEDADIEVLCFDVHATGSDFGKLFFEIADFCEDGEPRSSLSALTLDNINESVLTGVMIDGEHIYGREGKGQNVQYHEISDFDPTNTNNRTVAIYINHKYGSYVVEYDTSNAEYVCDTTGQNYSDFRNAVRNMDTSNTIPSVSEGEHRQLVIRTDGDMGPQNNVQIYIDNIRYKKWSDCNGDWEPDEITLQIDQVFPDADANNDGVFDACQDCNGNDVFDDVDIERGDESDCNGNGIPDSCDIDRTLPEIVGYYGRYGGGSTDLNANSIPDDCEEPLWNDPNGRILPPPIYSVWNEYSCNYGQDHAYYGGEACYRSLVAPGKWTPSEDAGFPGYGICGNGIGECDDCWYFFPMWYYQGFLINNGQRYPIEQAPIMFGDFELKEGGGGTVYAPEYYARFQRIEGMDCIQDVSLECSRNVSPVTTAARYRIKVGGKPGGAVSSRPVYSGALFWVTAVYDPTIFEVKVNGWTRTHPTDAWNYYHKELRNYEPLMFQDWIGGGWDNDQNILVLLEPGNTEVSFRTNEWYTVPDYVEVKLKGGHSADSLGGRSVQLMLHTLNWAGMCDDGIPHKSEIMKFERTANLTVGACKGFKLEDWKIEPPALKNECKVPQIASEQQAAEFEVSAIGVVNDTNVSLPSMQVGYTSWRAGRTLAESLGNDAYWHNYAIYDPQQQDANDASFLRINLHGIWYAVEDLPDWSWTFEQDTCGRKYLRVTDNCAGLSYDYFIRNRWNDDDEAIDEDDFSFQYAKLRRVVDHNDGNSIQRVYHYAGEDISSELESQVDSQGNVIRYDVSYDYWQTGEEVVDLKVTGYSDYVNQEYSAVFGEPTYGGASGSRQLKSATVVGDGAARTYEWYPIEGDHPVGNAGKLKEIRDAADTVLADFEYDNAGRLTKRKRGETVIAEYTYDYPGQVGGGSSTQSPSDALFEDGENGWDAREYDMEAKFYIDEDLHHETIVRHFDEFDRIREIHQFMYLDATLEHLRDPAVTLLSYQTNMVYQTPPEDVNEIPNDSFLFQDCGYPALRVVEQELPIGGVSRYSVLDCDSNVLETFMADSGLNTEPDNTAKKFRSVNTYIAESSGTPAIPRGITQPETTTKYVDSTTTATTELEYDDSGYLTKRYEPTVDVGVTTPHRQTRTVTLDSRHRVDYEVIEQQNGAGSTILVDYDYDIYGNRTSTTQSSGGVAISETNEYDAFGRMTKFTDADGYVHMTRFSNGSGLIEKTYTYATGDTGNVIEEIVYDYENGRLKGVSVADHNGEFALDSPDQWFTTKYNYDDFGRVTSKTITSVDEEIYIDYLTHYEYDYQDRLVKITYPDGIWKRLIRGGRGEITGTQIGNGENPAAFTSVYSYDANGNLTKKECEGSPSCAESTEYYYDDYNRLTKKSLDGQASQ